MTSFFRKIAEATRLTRLGRLGEATAALQRALAPHDAAPESRPAEPAHASAERHDAVLDGLVRDITAHDAAAAATAAEPWGAAPIPGFFPHSYSGPDGTRAYKLFVPRLPDGRPRPLVVMLHGCKQDPDDFAAGTRMNELAQAQGIYVLYPAQAVRSNAQRCWNWFMPADQKRDQGEPALLAAMTRQVMQAQAIDPARVFVAGLSAGGAMAAILASEYADLYAAAGVHSGLPPGAAHDLASALAAMKQGRGSRRTRSTHAPAPAPVIVFHGDADATVAPANGNAVIAAALAGEATATAFAAGEARASTFTTAQPESAEATVPAGVSERRAAEGARRAYRRTVWQAAATAPSQAELWEIEGAGHAWAGGASAGSYTDPDGPDASREMVRFFLEHPRRAPAP